MADHASVAATRSFTTSPAWVTVDGPTTTKMLKLAEEASQKNLKVGVGLMWRHCAARRELTDRRGYGLDFGTAHQSEPEVLTEVDTTNILVLG